MKSKQNKIVQLGNEYILPLLEGKKSFETKNDDYKKYVWYVEFLFKMANEDIKNKVESKKSNETARFYDNCYHTYVTNQNEN